jgi:hypothetical protein
MYFSSSNSFKIYVTQIFFSITRLYLHYWGFKSISVTFKSILTEIVNAQMNNDC